MYSLSKAITWNDVDDGAVILVHGTGEYLHIDSTTCYAVQRLVNGSTLPQLIDELSKRYQEVTPEQLYSDYEDVLRILVDKGILEELQ